MRVHSNFAEYVPLTLLMIYLVEVTGAPPLWVHGLGISVLLGRVSHAFGVSQTQENYVFRVAGMAMTFTPLIVSALRLLWVYAGEGVAWGQKWTALEFAATEGLKSGL